MAHQQEGLRRADGEPVVVGQSVWHGGFGPRFGVASAVPHFEAQMHRCTRIHDRPRAENTLSYAILAPVLATRNVVIGGLQLVRQLQSSPLIMVRQHEAVMSGQPVAADHRLPGSGGQQRQDWPKADGGTMAWDLDDRRNNGRALRVAPSGSPSVEHPRPANSGCPTCKL